MRIALIITTVAVLGIDARGDAPTAEDLYVAGQKDYDEGNFAGATKLWEESYALSKEPALLFNVAQAKRQSGDCAGALSTYRSFIAADPASDQKPLAEDLARELEAKCDPKSPPVDPPEHNPKPDQAGGLNLAAGLNGPKHGGADPGRTLKIAGAATGAAGGVLVVAGLVLGHHGNSLGDEVTAACASSCDWAAQKDKDAAGRRDVSIGYAIDALGVAAIASGAVMYYLGHQQSAITVAPAPRESGAVVTWSGSW